MAGCECEIWKQTEDDNEDNKLGYATHGKFWFLDDFAIEFCPWCGSKLTPPEEAGDEVE